MNTRNYLTNLINEKANISMETTIEVEGKEWGLNIIPLEAIVETIIFCSKFRQGHDQSY